MSGSEVGWFLGGATVSLALLYNLASSYKGKQAKQRKLKDLQIHEVTELLEKYKTKGSQEGESQLVEFAAKGKISAPGPYYFYKQDPTPLVFLKVWKKQDIRPTPGQSDLFKNNESAGSFMATNIQLEDSRNSKQTLSLLALETSPNKQHLLSQACKNLGTHETGTVKLVRQAVYPFTVLGLDLGITQQAVGITLGSSAVVLGKLRYLPKQNKLQVVTVDGVYLDVQSLQDAVSDPQIWKLLGMALLGSASAYCLFRAFSKLLDETDKEN